MANPANSFQSSVNIFEALGVPGELSFDGPIRSTPYNLYSAGTPNIVGYAYSVSAAANPDPSGAAANGGNAQVGGTGVFAGILVNPKAYSAAGTTSGGPLAATLVLADYSIGELLTMGQVYVSLPGPANVGDLVAYNTSTGALISYAANVTFTGSIAAGGASTPDVLTVTAISNAGTLSIGQQITGTGVAGGTFIASLDSGLGGLGTYNLNTINLQTVSSEAMIATPNNPPAAWAVSSGYIVGTTMTITTVTSGQLNVGDLVSATGILPNTVITAILTGHGGAGTYTVSQSQTLFSSGTPGAFTGGAYQKIDRCVVGRFGNQAPGGVTEIILTN